MSLSKCNCVNCSGHIEFPEEMAGQSITCPHCQLETLLFIPPKPILSAKPTLQTSAFTVIIMLAAAIGFFIWKPSKIQPAEPAPRPTPNIAPQPVPIPKPAISHAADAEMLVKAAVQRAVDHYNSASEVAYRESIDTKLHFQHLEMMNHIQRGDSDLELEIIKLRHQQEIQFLEAAHATKEAEWQRQEDERTKEWQNLQNGVKQ
jgi:hypothetical protein